MSLNKICKKCSIEHPIANFSKHSGTKDKLDSRCKACVKIMRDNTERPKMPRELDILETDLSNIDWQGGKISGTILPRNGKFEVRVNGTSKTCSTMEVASITKKQMSDDLGQTKNQYKIINNKVTQKNRISIS